MCAHVEVRGQPVGVSSIYFEGSGDQNQVIKVGGKYLDPPSNPATPGWLFCQSKKERMGNNRVLFLRARDVSQSVGCLPSMCKVIGVFP